MGLVSFDCFMVQSEYGHVRGRCQFGNRAGAQYSMTDAERRIADVIRNAFRGVTLGDGVGLLQAQGLDDYADSETLAHYRSQDEQDDWSRIPVSMLNSCSSSLSFFDAEGMRFHLPAYLIADLEGTLSQDVLFYLIDLEHGGTSKFEKLSKRQREAVRGFLFLRLDDPKHEFERPMIEETLLEYW
jgi:hypothetical protein